MRVLAIVGDAEYLCMECASARYSGATREHGYLVGSDSEGNELGALYSWDEWRDTDSPDCQALTCSQCDYALDISHSDECGIGWSDDICESLAVWTVGTNTPGYSPDEPPSMYVSWEDARASLVWDLERSADELADILPDEPGLWETVGEPHERALESLRTLPRFSTWSDTLPMSSSPHDLGRSWWLSALTE